MTASSFVTLPPWARTALAAAADDPARTSALTGRVGGRSAPMGRPRRATESNPTPRVALIVPDFLLRCADAMLMRTNGTDATAACHPGCATREHIQNHA